LVRDGVVTQGDDMKAIAQDGYGPAEVLQLREVEPPTIGPREVLVQVAAAGLDPGVWHLMTGRPYLVRAMGFGLRRPKVPVRGRDLAGVVAAVGPEVTRFTVGDLVYGTGESGSFAQFAAARQDRLAKRPTTVSVEQAAVTPISAVTALQALRDAAGTQAGQRVMVIGAAGGVGHFAVQIATALGAKVTGVCHTTKADLVRRLGAVDVIDYTTESVDSHGPRHDVIIDTAGNRPLSLLRRALTPHGTLVIVGGEHGGGPLLAGFDRQLRAPLASAFTHQRLRALIAKENAADLDQITALIESGAIIPVLDRSYPLPDTAEAIRYLAQGHPAGKVAITI
jgi:NADPH:quinone reductase-like Zn-dependent oxidoreductase